MISATGPVMPRGAWVGLLLLAAFSTPGLADQRVATRLEVFGFAGMNVLTLQNRVEESGDHYTVTTDYATKGLASVFVNLTTHAVARGRVLPGSAQPEWFRNDSRRNGTERHSHVDYRPDGAVEGAATPALPVPLPMAAMKGTIPAVNAARAKHGSEMASRIRTCVQSRPPRIVAMGKPSMRRSSASRRWRIRSRPSFAATRKSMSATFRLPVGDCRSSFAIQPRSMLLWSGSGR